MREHWHLLPRMQVTAFVSFTEEVAIMQDELNSVLRMEWVSMGVWALLTPWRAVTSSSLTGYKDHTPNSMALGTCVHSDNIGCRPLGSSPHAISQARILEWVAISYSRASSWPRDRTCVSCVSCIDRLFTTSATWKALKQLLIIGCMW